jgi:predicted MFS family arabinose efflux permease
LPLTAVFVLNASPLQMGILSGTGAAVVLVFGLFAGAWADRLRRRPIMIGADLGRAVLLGSVPLAAVLGWLSIHHLYLIAASTAMLNLLFDVAYQAYLPSLVERENILEGNSKLALTETTAEVIGPGLTGVLVQLLTAPVAILFDAVSFVVSAVSLTLIRKPEPVPERSQPHLAREILEGLRLSWNNPVLRAMAARTGTAAFFGGIFASLYILYAVRELRLSAALVGLIISIGGGSSLVGALVAQPLVNRLGFGLTFIGSTIGAGLAAFMVPLAHGPVALASTFLALSQLGDFVWPIYYINETTLRQASAPDHVLGRVNSATLLLFRGLMPVGALAGGVIAQAAGIRPALYVAAAGMLASSLWLIFSPIRKMRELPISREDRRIGTGSST